MEKIVDYFCGGNGGNFFAALIIVGAIIAVVERIVNWCGEKLKKYYNVKKGKETLEKTIENHSTQINEVKSVVEQLVKTFNTLEDKIEQYSTKQQRTNTVMLRDGIYEIYKETIRKGYILDKDKQNFKYAFDEYVANGGNSYVIDEIEPFIHNAKVFLSDEEAADAMK